MSHVVCGLCWGPASRRTTCGHLFCAPCIMQLIIRSHDGPPAVCPTCRERLPPEAWMVPVWPPVGGPPATSDPVPAAAAATKPLAAGDIRELVGLFAMFPALSAAALRTHYETVAKGNVHVTITAACEGRVAAATAAELAAAAAGSGGGGGGGGNGGGGRAASAPAPAPRAARIDFADLAIDHAVVLGEGRFGRILAAHWNGLEVAVKELPVDALGGMAVRDAALKTLRNEVHVLADLTHPSILPLYGYYESADKGRFGLVMERAFGDLYGLLQRLRVERASGRGRGAGCVPSGLTVPAFLAVLRGLAGALAAMHKRRPPVVHRDIKSPKRASQGGRPHALAVRLWPGARAGDGDDGAGRRGRRRADDDVRRRRRYHGHGCVGVARGAGRRNRRPQRAQRAAVGHFLAGRRHLGGVWRRHALERGRRLRAAAQGNFDCDESRI